MAKYRLTLEDEDGETVNMESDDLNALSRRLERKASKSHKRYAPRGRGGACKTARGWRAYRELPPDPATGKRRRVDAYGSTRAMAEERLKRKLEDTADGWRSSPHPPTVGEWMRTWLYDIAKTRVKPLAWGTYESVTRNYITPSIGGIRLDKLAPHHLRHMEQWITQGDPENGRRACSTSTARSAWQVLRAALSSAVREGVIRSNPCAMCDPPRIVRKERAFLSPGQAALMIGMEPDPMWRLMWHLAFTTGMRQGERLGIGDDELITVENVPCISVEWQLQKISARELAGMTADAECTPMGRGMYRTRPKTNAGRRLIPLPDRLAREISEYRAANPHDSGLLFEDADGLPLTPRAERWAWDKALERAGLEPVSPHSARHTAATVMARLGLDSKSREGLMGHSSISVTDTVYTHTDVGMLLRGTLGVEQALEAGDEGVEVLTADAQTGAAESEHRQYAVADRGLQVPQGDAAQVGGLRNGEGETLG